MNMTHIMSADVEVAFSNLSMKNKQIKVLLKLSLKQAQQSAISSKRAEGRIATNAAGAVATKSVTKQLQAAESVSNAWEQFYQQNDAGDTSLHLACYAGLKDAVAALIRLTPHPYLFSLQNDEAQTPLHLAVLAAQPSILRMLLVAGAEPNTRDGQGNTALHLACISGAEQCVRALTLPISVTELRAHRNYVKSNTFFNCARLPADMAIRNYAGECCVYLAARAGHIEVLRSLVRHGADINAREGKSGRTPLHIAVEVCNENLTNFLLDECFNLDLEEENFAGLTSYQVACMLNNSQMQNKLEKRTTAGNAGKT